MNTFFLEYRDPLFSIIIFFVIIFIITFFSYWWGRFKSKEDSRDLNKFLKQFRSLPSKNELKVMISGGEISEKSWLLLAQSYYKNGEFEKSIEIYNELLSVLNSKNTKETLFLLGRTYFKAGFLERAKKIFLEILKNNPRTPQALHYLLLVYEYMRDYKSALEVLEPLEELNTEIESEALYLKILSLLNDFTIDDEQKIKELLSIYKLKHEFTYMIFEYLFRVNPKVAWKSLDNSKCELLSDILWHLDKRDLDLDIISNNGYLREIYSARGDVDFSKKSNVFELDILIKLGLDSTATLSFEYVCDDCKRVFPFSFHRCSSCHSIDSLSVEMSLSKDYQKDYIHENNSFV